MATQVVHRENRGTGKSFERNCRHTAHHSTRRDELDNICEEPYLRKVVKSVENIDFRERRAR